MALTSLENVVSQDVQQVSNSIWSVIDIEFIKKLNIKSGKTEQELASAINKRAEEQVNDDDEIKNLYALSSNLTKVDTYFDAELKHDKAELQAILGQYVDVISDTDTLLGALWNAITFDLTQTGKENISKRNSVMTTQQTQNYYNSTNDWYEVTNIIPNTVTPEPISYSPVAPVAPSKITADATNAYQVKNIPLSNEKDTTSQRKALRWLLLKRPEILDIVNDDEKLSPDQKKQLRDLHHLIKSIGVDNFSDVYIALQQAYNASSDIRSDAVLSSLWLETDIKRDKRELKKLKQLASIYADYRDHNLSGKYAERLFGVFEREVGSWSLDFVTAFNNNNNDVITDPDLKISNRKAKRELNDDALLSSGKELNMTPSEIQKAKVLVGKRGDNKNTAFVNLLQDYTFDGKVMFDDRAMTSGLQMWQQYLSAVNDLRTYAFENNEQKAQENINFNILDMVKDQAIRTWHKQLAEDLKTFLACDPKNSAGCNVVHEELKNGNDKYLLSWEKVQQFMLAHPQYTKYIQQALNTNPMNLKYIFKSGVRAFENFNTETRDSYLQQETKNAGLDTQSVQKIEQRADQQRTTLSTQAKQEWIDITSDKEHIRNTLVSSMVWYVGDTWIAVKWWWAGIAVWVPLDQILKWLSLNLSAGVVTDGSGPWTKPMLGIALSHTAEFGKSWVYNNFSMGTAFSPGGWGLLWFVPFISESITKQRELKNKNHKNNLDTKKSAIKTISIWVWAKVLFLWPIPTPLVGAHLWMEKNKLAGIEKQFGEVRSSMNKISQNVVDLFVKSPWATQQGMIANITSVLKKEFNKTKDASLITQAAQNIYKGMTSFWDLSKADAFTKTRVADMMSEFYALQWKNAAVEKVRWWFAGFDIGIDWIVGTMVFIPSLAITFDKYYGLRYVDTKESQQDIENADDHWYGNVLLSSKSWIEQQEVDFMNREIETFSSQQTEKMPDIKLFPNNPNIMMIPQDLYLKHNLNVKLDAETMKGKLMTYVNPEDGITYLLAPKNTTYRLWNFGYGQESRMVLNVGDNKSDDQQDLRLLNGSESKLTSDKWIFEGDIDAYKKMIETLPSSWLTQSAVDASFANALSKMQWSSLGNDVTITLDKWLITIIDKKTNQILQSWINPSSIVSIKKDSTGTITATATPNTKNELSFELTEVFNKPWQWLTVDTIQAKINTNKKIADLLTMVPENWWLRLSLKNDPSKTILLSVPFTGSIILSDNNIALHSGSGSLEIIVDKTWQSDIVENLDGKVFEFDTKDTQLQAAHDFLKKSENRVKLQELENNDPLAYAALIDAMSDANTDWWLIDDDNITKAIAALNKLLKDKFPELTDILKWDNSVAKAFVLDSMKAILAMEDVGYKNQTIGQLFAHRSDAFRRVSFPVWWSPESWITREQTKQLFSEYLGTRYKDTKKESVSNLIGYTAFYRKNSQGTGRKYSMTPPAFTEVIGWKDGLRRFESNDSRYNTIKETLVSSVLKQKYEQDMMVSLVKNYLKKSLANSPMSTQLDTIVSNISNNSVELKKFFMWELITIPNTTYTIQLNTTPAMYLLWACANESFGLLLDSVIIKDTASKEKLIISDDDAEQTLSATSDAISVTQWWWSLFTNDTYTRLEAMKERKTFQIWFAMKLWWKTGWDNKKFNDGKWDSENWWSNNPTNTPGPTSGPWWDNTPTPVPTWTTPKD